jgi:hypothetical protein
MRRREVNMDSFQGGGSRHGASTAIQCQRTGQRVVSTVNRYCTGFVGASMTAHAVRIKRYFDATFTARHAGRRCRPEGSASETARDWYAVA